ncbi:MAG: RsmE family RNA methyltransferase [Candidatus Omnitrophica bacterium]|nr:RsmE family RNA methyltransferase [Candidatus Omnitrophota bacterium]
MTHHHFYCTTINPNNNKVIITEKKEVHHLWSVLRFKKGEEISVFNGNGLEGLGVITSASKDAIEIKILSFSNTKPHQPLFAIACAVPKRSKFETIIEKCTELGIDEIIPLQTIRTEIRGHLGSSGHRNKRYQDIAINASKQCCRAILPKIHSLTTFSDALNQVSADDLALIGCLKGKPKKFPDLNLTEAKEKKRIIVFIGPEGDFTDEEIENALQKGCVPITLGPNTLKVETAAISSIAYLMLYLRS